jgi:hypothetical protein
MMQCIGRSVSVLVLLAWRFLSTLRTMPEQSNGQCRG